MRSCWRGFKSTQPLSNFKTPEGEAKYLRAYDAALSLWPVPFDSQQVSTRWGSTHVIASGPAGAPGLVLLHGMSLSATMWFANIAGLAQRFRVFAVDTIGSAGRSVASQPIRSRADFAAWLDDLCSGLGLARTHLMGHSQGGWVALNFALSAPERVNRLVLLAPAGALRPLAIQFYLRGIPVFLFPVRPLIAGFMRWMTVDGFVVNESFFNQFALGMKYSRLQIKVLPSVFADAELRQITTPTLLLIGDREVICDPALAVRRAQQLIPHLEAEIIPNSNHGLPMEKPELINERVLRFLSQEAEQAQQAA